MNLLKPVFVSVGGIITGSMTTPTGSLLRIKSKDGIKGIIDGDGREVRKIKGRWIHEA